ncbi:MAG: hypothetical protein EOO03_01510 [Chitinophagaceae bacterium]|nr:MAG: hypothetical protein EOO03_01510 [Chitinophagaceae bacterium]
MLNNQFAAAEKQFLKAIEISPQWAIPWSNLVGLYAITNQYKQADSAFRKAVALQPNLQNSFANAGSIYEMKGDLLFAEELQRKSIALNSRHYFPFERLANIYLKTTNYASADSFYFEATIRKQGYYFSPLASRVLLPVFQFSETEKLPCVFDSMLVSQADVPGNFAWALHSYKRGDLATAEQKLKLVIALDQKHPLAFHYLGKLLSEQKRWQEAAIILEYATEYFADSIAFNHYLNSLSRQLSASTQSDCLLQTLRDAYYPPQHNHYLLGNLYENWQYFSEAETNFRTVIELEPYFMGGYYRLWTMQEKLGRYLDAEKTIQHFASINPMDGLNELNSFYKRVTQRFPADGYWFYKAGQFCYDIAAGKASNFIYDLKTVLPDDTIASFETKIRVAATSRALVIGVLRESIQTASPILSPMSHGIRYLTTADSLLALDDNAIADINGKIADLLFWQGLPQESALRYEKAIALQRHNASIRSKMVGAYTTTFQNRNALQQLEFLKSNHELNFHQQILLAQLYLHAGRFAEADTLVNNSKQIHPYAKPEFVLIPAKRFLMSKQFAKAVKQYLNYLKDTPTDANAMYSVARSYARMSRNRDAWDWLQRAVQNGFGYAYVLENDECWNKMRKAHRWKEFMSRQKFVAYSVPETSMKPD